MHPGYRIVDLYPATEREHTHFARTTGARKGSDSLYRKIAEHYQRRLAVMQALQQALRWRKEAAYKMSSHRFMIHPGSVEAMRLSLPSCES